MRNARSFLCPAPVVALGLLAPLALAACNPTVPASDGGPGGSRPTGCTLAFLGDASKAPVVQPLALGPDMTDVPLHPDDMVLLSFPPQGGRVIFAGVRATNLDPCGVQLTGAIRDETTQEVRLDARTVNLLPSGDGWGASNPTDISTFANVPVCPNEWSTTNLYGTEYQLELTVTDRAGRTVTQKLPVVPECSEPVSAAVCECICMGGYVLGESCALDGGPGDGGAGDGGPGDGGPGDGGIGDGGTGGDGAGGGDGGK